MERFIIVTFRREGIHRYPDAEHNPKLKTGGWDDVSFLAYPHMHYFYFRVTLEIFHNDREVEFIQFNRWLNRLYSNSVLNLDYKSCEMIAEDLIAKIKQKYPGRRIEVEVYEDNINGAKLVYKPEKEKWKRKLLRKFLGLKKTT